MYASMSSPIPLGDMSFYFSSAYGFLLLMEAIFNLCPLFVVSFSYNKYACWKNYEDFSFLGSVSLMTFSVLFTSLMWFYYVLHRPIKWLWHIDLNFIQLMLRNTQNTWYMNLFFLKCAHYLWSWKLLAGSGFLLLCLNHVQVSLTEDIYIYIYIWRYSKIVPISPGCNLMSLNEGSF